MPNTYTQILIQFVFVVKFRQSLIHENIREGLEKYMTGIISEKGHKPLAIYCMPDHCHILVGLNPSQSISDTCRDIKANSSKWINEQNILPVSFRWQEGYGAFSYSKSHLNNVVKYIMNQPNHHKKRSFKDEYLEFLEKYEVVYDSKYLFDFKDED